MDLQDLETWFRSRPKWLQDAARRLVQNGSLAEQDYADLLDICEAEVIGKKVAFSGVPQGALNVQETAQPLRLDSIEDVCGINALSPTKPLEFGKDPICVVYGRNGAGKSGYVRLLKHACGARRPGELHGDIFAAAKQPQSAKLVFTEGATTCARQWAGKAIPELQTVEIYDTAGGLVYVDEETEVVFEPWLLRLFTQLTNACAAVNSRLQARIAALPSKKPAIPIELQGTAGAEWYNKLTATTTTKEVGERTDWAAGDELELSEISKRLAESDPSKKAAALRLQKGLLEKVALDLSSLFEGLSDKRCEAYLRAKQDAAVKRRAAEEDAKKVFERAPLEGIGSDSWLLLWEAARRYSEEQAYKGVPFPNVGQNARCVLCQQLIDKEARDRFVSFEEFVKGELRHIAKEAEEYLQKIKDSFVEIPSAESVTTRLGAAGMAEASVRSASTDFVEALAARRRACLAADSMANIRALPPCELFVRLRELAAEVEKQAVACDEDAKGQNRPELQRNARELSVRKWLNQQRGAIDEEITRLIAVKAITEMQALTSTQALSIRKAKLTEELITTEYIARFKEELRRLGASALRVDLRKTRAQVGHVYHRIALRNAVQNLRTSDILSEGEFRIVSIAAFLADTEGRGAKTPFIFDDPVSSLDHVYESATAQRLVRLSRTRQVIVLTHRLSMVGLLEKFAKKAHIAVRLVCLSDYRTGEIVELPVNLARTDTAANRLADERLKAARKAFAEGDAAYRTEAEALCGDIRVLLERVVEKDLINDVVKRFGPEVNTKGKIHALAKITEEDCNFIDDYMTKYSVFEHSQPDEVPVALPTPDEMETDLKLITEFIRKLQQRLRQKEPLAA
jgi:ABC-type phosphate/phosphonate transport system ATPase subunit